jgi:hypothetical protein
MPFESESAAMESRCPVPREARPRVIVWLRRVGLLGFLIFLAKGIAWLTVPYLILKQ